MALKAGTLKAMTLKTMTSTSSTSSTSTTAATSATAATAASTAAAAAAVTVATPPMTMFSSLRNDNLWNLLCKDSILFHPGEDRHLSEFNIAAISGHPQQQRQQQQQQQQRQHQQPAQVIMVTSALSNLAQKIRRNSYILNENSNDNSNNNPNRRKQQQYTQVFQDINDFPVGEIVVEREDGIVFAKTNQYQHSAAASASSTAASSSASSQQQRQRKLSLYCVKYASRQNSEHKLFREAHFLSKFSKMDNNNSNNSTNTRHMLMFLGCFDKYYVYRGTPVPLSQLIPTTTKTSSSSIDHHPHYHSWKNNTNNNNANKSTRLRLRLRDVVLPLVRTIHYVHSRRVLIRDLSRDTVGWLFLSNNQDGNNNNNMIGIEQTRQGVADNTIDHNNTNHVVQNENNETENGRSIVTMDSEISKTHNDHGNNNAGGRVQLMSFEMARELKETDDQSNHKYQLTAMVGDWKYMAKEVAKGWRYNETADVYSFGILLWELVCGTLAFQNYDDEIKKKKKENKEKRYNNDNDNDEQQQQQQQQQRLYFLNRLIEREERPPIPDDTRVCPPRLVKLLRSCFSWNSNQRPASFRIIEQEIQTILEEL